MPVCFIEGPAGLPIDTRRQLVAGATQAIHAAYPIPDTRVVIHENRADHVGQDGVLEGTMRPICFLDVPPGIPDDKRRTLVRDLTKVIDVAYETVETLVFFREYPLHLVAAHGGLQSENPAILAALAPLSQAAR